MRLRSALFLVPALALAACASTSSKYNPPATPPTAPPIPTTGSAEPMTQRMQDGDIAKQISDYVNNERVQHGLKPFTEAPSLEKSAQTHSENMLSGNFLGTRGKDEPSVIIRMTNEGMHSTAIGENVLRLHENSHRVAPETLAIWTNTSADRANVLSRWFTKTGIGVTHDKEGDYYITQDFAQ